MLLGLNLIFHKVYSYHFHSGLLKNILQTCQYHWPETGAYDTRKFWYAIYLGKRL